MSLNSFQKFRVNLDQMMNSDAWRQADEAQRLNMGYWLINSKYGKGMPLPARDDVQKERLNGT